MGGWGEVGGLDLAGVAVLEHLLELGEVHGGELHLQQVQRPRPARRSLVALSTATILIEEPDVPADLVKSTVSTFANDRLQVIQQRVMTSQPLCWCSEELAVALAEQFIELCCQED